MKRSKKGISLAFVIVVVMALMIFSAMLFSAASHSMSMTGESTDGRQAYLTAKSAIEYAKSEAYDQAKAGELKPFAVSQDVSGAFTDIPNIDTNLGIYKNLNGTTNYATCTNPGGDGVNWKITAKVKYKNSAQYRQLAYDFKLQYGEDTLGAVNSYAAAGWRYGNNTILNSDNSFSGSPNIPYPFVSSKTVPITSQYPAAPEMYFLNAENSFSASRNGGTFSCSLDSNLIFFNGPITGGSTDAKNNQQNLTLQNSRYNRLSLNGHAGIVWFHNASISDYGITLKISDGAYYFNSGFNLFDSSILSSDKQFLPSVPTEDFQKNPSLKAMNLPAKVSYYEANAGKIKSSEKDGGVGWTDTGKLSTNPSDQTGNDVFLYTTKDMYNADLQNFHSSVIYKARSIAMQYMGTQDNPFTVPGQTITFQTGTFWFNAQSTDGYPADDTNVKDIPAIKGVNTDSHFIVKSPDDSHSPVKLILPHGLVVKDSTGGTVFQFDSRAQTDYNANDSSTFTFTVPSGTDLLSLSKLTRIPAGSGGSGGSGTFTITPGKYTGS